MSKENKKFFIQKIINFILITTKNTRKINAQNNSYKGRKLRKTGGEENKDKIINVLDKNLGKTNISGDINIDNKKDNINSYLISEFLYNININNNKPYMPTNEDIGKNELYRIDNKYLINTILTNKDIPNNIVEEI